MGFIAGMYLGHRAPFPDCRHCPANFVLNDQNTAKFPAGRRCHRVPRDARASSSLVSGRTRPWLKTKKPAAVHPAAALMSGAPQSPNKEDDCAAYFRGERGPRLGIQQVALGEDRSGSAHSSRTTPSLNVDPAGTTANKQL